MAGDPSGSFQSEVWEGSLKVVSPTGCSPELWSLGSGCRGAPLTRLPTQGLYQWIHRTHEDAQEAREAAGEDPGGEGAREEDQLDSGNGTGRP